MTAISAEATIIIDAPPEHVWAVMLDFSRYHEWNPFIVRVEQQGPVALGGRMRLHVRWNDGTTASSGEQITELVAPADGRPGCLAYRFTGLLPAFGLVRATRVQRVEPLPDGRTRWFTRERFTGRLIRFLPLAKVEDGFGRHACALKARAEQLTREPAALPRDPPTFALRPRDRGFELIARVDGRDLVIEEHLAAGVEGTDGDTSEAAFTVAVFQDGATTGVRIRRASHQAREPLVTAETWVESRNGGRTWCPCTGPLAGRLVAQFAEGSAAGWDETCP
ncbi:SRPBCC domain-containing protein [Nannocystis sp. SCPEA4]|uniref:SRPBCC domain-containing protein n=1 Tax=Nannocystis sp. SCPEA4 TaxID=2996787 RepID=UPI00226F36F6|nr:SRPBCC domain-containing protein [Nannocystis sp. SCPEA4]MCY1054548.1 SRPBCC domain-containing protein [Nannocystis sp. SCPEA4]